MKWIGQHIWDFISRFRNDVYLENVTESTQDHVVGIDADGKLYKQDVPVGDMTGVDISVGTGLDISQSNTTGGNYTSTINLDLTEAINTDGANRILTSDGNGNLTAEPNFTFDGNFLSLTAFTSTLTNSVSSNIIVENTGNNVAGGTLDFKNTRASGVDGDKAGQVRFFANNDGGTQRQVGELLSAIPETAAGSEYGNVSFETLNSNGQLRTGLRMTGVAGGNDKVNVTLGYDSTSDTTISGNAIVTGDLTVSGTTTTINTTDLNVEDKNITLNYHATNDTSASADTAGITIQDAVNASTDAWLKWDAAGDFWNFSHKVSLPDNSGVQGNNFWLNTDHGGQMTKIIGNANTSSKTIDLPNISGVFGVMDTVNSAYTIAGGDLFPQAGVYTQVINMDMATVYALDTTAVDIVPDARVHSSQTMMLLNAWAYVVTPNYTGGSGVVNTANIYMQMGCTAAPGSYNKAKGFVGSFQRIAWNQASNRTNVYRAQLFGGSSNYGNVEPGLGLKIWTNVDPSGSASSGSESITSIRLVVQYTIIPS